MAQDTGGVKDAGPWINLLENSGSRKDIPTDLLEQARKVGPLTYTVLVDQEHVVSRLYNMVNVPTGVWIDERGRIVRPNEVAFIDDRFKNFTGLDSAPYLNALKDWVEKGDKSVYVMSQEQLEQKLVPPEPDVALASAEFGLGEQLYKAGHPSEAIPHFKEAQRLNPKSWNYKRQAYKLSSESDYGTTFLQEVQKNGGSKVYYPPPELPKATASDGQEKKQ